MANDVVSYTCKRTTISTKPVQPGKYHHLSILDRLMEHNHLRIVYYYQSEKGAGELIKKAKESLSETLSCFPVTVGRLERDNEGHWMIKCNDAGMRTVEAKVKGSVEEWLKNVDREKELKLVHWEDLLDEPYFWSTFYIQVTEFEGGGLAIGLSCTHLLADPTCATMLIKAWADTTLAGKMIAPPLVHPLPPRRIGKKNINHKPYTHLINHYKSIMATTTTTSTPLANVKNATVALLFTDHMVQACMARARPANTTGGPSPSPFEALVGLFWICISKLKGHKNELINMSICLDMRRVLDLDKGFFGNCMVYNKVHGVEGFKENELLLLSEAAKAIGDVVAKMDDPKGILDLIEWLDCNDNKSCPSMINGCNHLICTSLEGLENPYLALFEDGFSPIRVSYYIEPVLGEGGQVLILPSPPSEGPLSRVVMVTLPEDKAVMLCEDALIMSFSPTILMGVNKNCI